MRPLPEEDLLEVVEREPRPACSRWYPETRGTANSASHSAASRGHRLPCGRQSVIERPDRVSRVMPPTTTIVKTAPLVPISHQPTARRDAWPPPRRREGTTTRRRASRAAQSRRGCGFCSSSVGRRRAGGRPPRRLRAALAKLRAAIAVSFVASCRSDRRVARDLELATRGRCSPFAWWLYKTRRPMSFAAPEAAAASALPEQTPSLAAVIAEASLSREPTRDAATLPYLEASVGPPPSKTGASSVDAAALLGLFGGPPPSAAPAPLDRGSSTSTSSPPTALCRGSSSSSGVFPPLGRTASTSSVASSSSDQKEKKCLDAGGGRDAGRRRDEPRRPEPAGVVRISKKLKAAGFDRWRRRAAGTCG